jgi:tetratricopeptide (TPR) repeat protein
MNKQIKDTIIGLVVIAVLAVAVIWLYNSKKPSRVLAKRVAELTARGSGVPETIEGLQKAIAIYEEQIERNVKEGAQTGVYWKILAIRFADRKMYNDALKAIERAIYYNGEDATLCYLTGEYASVVAASTLDFSEESTAEREQLVKLAESAYLRSIQLEPTYAKPRLGIGLLYTFDLDRAEEAIPHLERYVQLMPNGIEGMFVLARAYFMTEKFDSAIDMYDRIISRSKDTKVKQEAQNNNELIRSLMNG